MKKLLVSLVAVFSLMLLASCNININGSDVNIPGINGTTTAPTATAEPGSNTAGVPTTEAPKTDAPETKAPVTEAPKTDAPETKAPTTDVPISVDPTIVEPTTDMAEIAGKFNEVTDKALLESFIKDFTGLTISLPNASSYKGTTAPTDYTYIAAAVVMEGCEVSPSDYYAQLCEELANAGFIAQMEGEVIQFYYKAISEDLCIGFSMDVEGSLTGITVAYGDLLSEGEEPGDETGELDQAVLDTIKEFSESTVKTEIEANIKKMVGFEIVLPEGSSYVSTTVINEKISQYNVMVSETTIAAEAFLQSIAEVAGGYGFVLQTISEGETSIIALVSQESEEVYYGIAAIDGEYGMQLSFAYGYLFSSEEEPGDETDELDQTVLDTINGFGSPTAKTEIEANIKKIVGFEIVLPEGSSYASQAEVNGKLAAYAVLVVDPTMTAEAFIQSIVEVAKGYNFNLQTISEGETSFTVLVYQKSENIFYGISANNGEYGMELSFAYGYLFDSDPGSEEPDPSLIYSLEELESLLKGVVGENFVMPSAVGELIYANSQPYGENGINITVTFTSSLDFSAVVASFEPLFAEGFEKTEDSNSVTWETADHEFYVYLEDQTKSYYLQLRVGQETGGGEAIEITSIPELQYEIFQKAGIEFVFPASIEELVSCQFAGSTQQIVISLVFRTSTERAALLQEFAEFFSDYDQEDSEDKVAWFKDDNSIVLGNNEVGEYVLEINMAFNTEPPIINKDFDYWAIEEIKAALNGFELPMYVVSNEKAGFNVYIDDNIVDIRVSPTSQEEITAYRELLLKSGFALDGEDDSRYIIILESGKIIVTIGYYFEESQEILLYIDFIKTQGAFVEFPSEDLKQFSSYNIPAFTGASSYDSEVQMDFAWITCYGVTEAQAETYLATLKAAGFICTEDEAFKLNESETELVGIEYYYDEDSGALEISIYHSEYEAPKALPENIQLSYKSGMYNYELYKVGNDIYVKVTNEEYESIIDYYLKYNQEEQTWTRYQYIPGMSDAWQEGEDKYNIFDLEDFFVYYIECVYIQDMNIENMEYSTISFLGMDCLSYVSTEWGVTIILTKDGFCLKHYKAAEEYISYDFEVTAISTTITEMPELPVSLDPKPSWPTEKIEELLGGNYLPEYTGTFEEIYSGNGLGGYYYVEMYGVSSADCDAYTAAIEAAGFAFNYSTRRYELRVTTGTTGILISFSILYDDGILSISIYDVEEVEIDTWPVTSLAKEYGEGFIPEYETAEGTFERPYTTIGISNTNEAEFEAYKETLLEAGYAFGIDDPYDGCLYYKQLTETSDLFLLMGFMGTESNEAIIMPMVVDTISWSDIELVKYYEGRVTIPEYASEKAHVGVSDHVIMVTHTTTQEIDAYKTALMANGFTQVGNKFIQPCSEMYSLIIEFSYTSDSYLHLTLSEVLTEELAAK